MKQRKDFNCGGGESKAASTTRVELSVAGGLKVEVELELLVLKQDRADTPNKIPQL